MYRIITHIILIIMNILLPSQPFTLRGQSQTITAGLNTVPGPQSITYVPPLAHCKNFVQSKGWAINPVT